MLSDPYQLWAWPWDRCIMCDRANRHNVMHKHLGPIFCVHTCFIIKPVGYAQARIQMIINIKHVIVKCEVCKGNAMVMIYTYQNQNNFYLFYPRMDRMH